MNVCVMMGRLTRDPEVRYGASGTAFANYSIAVDRRFKREGQPDADFFNCVSFGKQAEFVEKYLHKGTKVVIQGSMQNDNYQNREGQTVYRDRIVVDNVEFAESKAASQQNAGGYNAGPYNANARQYSAPMDSAPVQPRQVQRREEPASDFAGDGFMNIPDGIDEELPFN
ncbi:MAG: single-stranded DNA-binding protein [Lachnospiraceae bacterium]|nr:single-stranded DNA-binding protein [Lachnospiraceae bacterium]